MKKTPTAPKERCQCHQLYAMRWNKHQLLQNFSAGLLQKKDVNVISSMEKGQKSQKQMQLAHRGIQTSY
jgi:hypothetical protein